VEQLFSTPEVVVVALAHKEELRVRVALAAVEMLEQIQPGLAFLVMLIQVAVVVVAPGLILPMTTAAVAMAALAS